MSSTFFENFPKMSGIREIHELGSGDNERNILQGRIPKTLSPEERRRSLRRSVGRDVGPLKKSLIK